nr:hypothetical protein [Tanacetum cinerariifolium]
FSDNSNPKTVVSSSSDLNLSFDNPLYLHPNDTSDSSNHGLANQWNKCNSVVVTWILNSLSPELFAGAIYAKTASGIWNDLKETYDKFLMGLVESYLAIRSNLLTREPLPSVKTAISIISGEESHRNVTSVGTTKPAATAFVVKTFDNKRKFNNNYKGSGSNSNSNFNNNNNRGSNPNLKCINCNKIDHTVNRCFELIGYPTGYVKRNFNSNSKPVTSNNASTDVHSNGASSNNATTSNSIVSLSSEIPSSVMAGKSPYSYVYGHDPSLSHLRGNDAFGATSMDEINNTHPEGTVSDETDFLNDFYVNSEFNYETEDLPVHTLRRSSRQTKLPSSLNDFIVEGKIKYEAILDSNWIDVMNAEIEALNENHTWEITDLPTNRKSIGNKCVIALSVTSNWPLFQLDVNNAFLYGDLDEDIYMTIPKGFASKDNKNKSTDLSSAASEIIWIQKLLLDLNTKVILPIDLHCDNKSALRLALIMYFMKGLITLRLMCILSEKKLQKDY